MQPVTQFPRLFTTAFLGALASTALADAAGPMIDLYAGGADLAEITRVGSTTSQGDFTLNAHRARGNFGVNGAGIKIGVISDSFNDLGGEASGIASGDLPGVGNPNGYNIPVTVVQDDLSGRSDEGRAMAEIIHDVAPGAQIFFHSAFNNGGAAYSDQTIATAIDNLAAAVGPGGIIVDDVGILTAPRFQDGFAAQAVNAAKANGIAYFSAAGNSADDATRGSAAAGFGSTVNWGSDDVLLVNYNSSGSVLNVQWNDPYDSVSGTGPASDYTVHLTSPDGLTTLFSADNFDTDPFELFGVAGGSSGLLGIRVECTANCDGDSVVQLSTHGGFEIVDTDDTNSPTTFGHAAATGGLAVAAHRYDDLNNVEYFSSKGGNDIYFDVDGSPLYEFRDTIALTGPDGGNTTFFGFDYEPDGFPNFFGTSAAAPHVAAVAALVLDYASDLGGSLGVDDLYELLLASTVDIETAGYDDLSGFGRLDAFLAQRNVQEFFGAPLPASALLLLVGLMAIRWQRLV